MRKNAIIAGAIIVGLFGTGLAFLLIINQSRYQNTHQKSITQAGDQSRHQDAQGFVAQAGTDAALDKPKKLLDLSTPENTLES